MDWDGLSEGKSRFASENQPMKLRAEMGPVVPEESFALMYMMLLSPPGDLNSSTTLAVLPVFSRRLLIVGWQPAAYG